MLTPSARLQYTPPPLSRFVGRKACFQKRAEYGFGECGFKPRAQWVFRDSLSSGERAQWVPFSLVFVCKRELTEFCRRTHRVWPKTQRGSVSSLLRNSTLETLFRPFPIFEGRGWGIYFEGPCSRNFIPPPFIQTPPSYGFGRYGFGFFGPRIAFPATGALWGRATPFSFHFSVHLSSVLGRTELCHEVWTPGPQKPQIISNENHHLALLDSYIRRP